MKKFFLFFSVFVLLFLIPTGLAKASELKNVFQVTVNQKFENLNRPIFTGLIENVNYNTEVSDGNLPKIKVFINKEFSGFANINFGNTKVNNFYFQPVNVLAPGKYTVNFSFYNSGFSEDISFTVLGLNIDLDASVSAPTLIPFDSNKIITNQKPLVAGLTNNGTFVHVFIDNIYNGKIKVFNHKSGTANFAYKPFLNLKPGIHKIYTIAENANGKKSKPSKEILIKIEPKLPSAKLLDAYAQTDIIQSYYITGLTKNDLIVKVYVDHKLDGLFSVVNHVSGTANFKYRIKTILTNGKHLIYTETVDKVGKVSEWSNFLNIEAVQKKINSLGVSVEKEINSVEEEKTEPVSTENENIKLPIIEKDVTLEKEIVKDIKKPETEKAEIEEILNIDIMSTTTETGTINENKDNPGRSWSLLMFTLFLVAVISWIFWVNKELIKEQTEPDDKK